jgi:hypothetical protein
MRIPSEALPEAIEKVEPLVLAQKTDVHGWLALRPILPRSTTPDQSTALASAETLQDVGLIGPMFAVRWPGS